MATLSAGDVISIGEDHYMYGTGNLRLRVTEIGHVQCFDGDDWLNLRGLQLRSDGSQLSEAPRYALVRLKAIRVHAAVG